MKTLKCRDVGFDCEAVEEVLAQVQEVHNVEVTPEMVPEMVPEIERLIEG